MEYRIDSARGQNWRNQNDSSFDNTRLQRNPTEAELRLEFAEKLTRVSAVLGVLTHLVRTELLREDERVRFAQSVELAQRELAEAGGVIRDNRRIVGNNLQRHIDVSSAIGNAMDSLRSRLVEEGIETNLELGRATVQCDQLALDSLIVGMLQLAIGAVSQMTTATRHITARAASSAADSVLITLETTGPGCANEDAPGSTPTSEQWQACVERCMQLASVLGGSLSIRRPVHGDGLLIRSEIPTVTAASASTGSK